MNTWQSLLLVIGFLGLAIGARYWLGKAAHSFHVGGAKGYLKDILLEVGVSYAPFLLIVFAVKVYIDVNPQHASSPMVLGSIGVAVVAMLLAKRIPIAKAASNRLIEARSKRWEALKQP